MDTVLLRNVLSMIIWQGGNYVVPLITLPYLSRAFGVETFGEVALAYAIVAYFTLLTEWGFSLSTTREISANINDREAVDAIFWDTLSAKFILAATSFALLIAIMTVIPSLKPLRELVFAASTAVLANVITVNWCLQGLERLDFFAVGSLVGKIATVPLILLLVHGPEDAALSIFIQTGGQLFSGFLSLYLLDKTGYIGRPKFSWRGAMNQLRAGWDIFLSTASVNLYTTTNTVIIGSIAGSVGVGNYSGADRLKTAAQGLTSPISQAVYPRVARLMSQDPKKAFDFIDRLFIVQSAGTFLISLALWIFAPEAVRLVLGPEYGGAVPILEWLAWLPFIVGISNVFGLQVLLQTGQQRLFSKIISSAVPLSLGLTISCVYIFGAEGAAIAVFVTELYVTVMMAFFAFRSNKLLFSPIRKALWRAR